MALEGRIEVTFGEKEVGNRERMHLGRWCFLTWVVVTRVCSLCDNSLMSLVGVFFFFLFFFFGATQLAGS